ncbi:MAG: 1,4-beta-D-glucan glucohydrolase [Sphingomonadales bacterium 32-64-17]|nr:MAG: 1,4-beta-D-glucan glucohydrolase [Sphingomonadales bacterium 32-64-17]
MFGRGTACAALLLVSACATVPVERAGQQDQLQADPMEARVQELLARMSLERKVAQLIQPQINSFTPEDMERYRFGSYLNGGNGGPYGDEYAPASEWLRLADEMYVASTQPLADGEPVIPTMWGTDAVHGHTNVVGATIFPQNIALGASGDADLVRRLGEATAIEIEVTGIDWNFSPTVAVAQDYRWGRTYESYSQDPDLVGRLGAALVEGLQGQRGSANWLGEGHVIATAKHFFGDGGTDGGVDQGDVNGDLAALEAIHARPYRAVIDADVASIMASFNSINGRKMHGNKELLSDYLRGELGFKGLTVGDWNGHGQVAGCEVDDCPQSVLAGLDIYMVPDDWRALHTNLLAQVRDGTIPLATLDEAVARVLRVKYQAGLLDDRAKRPAERDYAGRYDLLASPDHRALAREAVAKSQVVLKNDGVLPLAAGANVLVAGTAADNIGQAAGGWTIEWQGGRELDRALFPNATSIWEGLRDAVQAEGGTATLSEDGSFTTRPDVAVVVFGEAPYAEFAGDKPDLVLRDEEGLELLRKFRAEGVRTVAVFLSGRPLWMNRELNAADAFVASWLPGSEGTGIADVLTGARPATGRLSFSWPAVCSGSEASRDEGALFPLGYGHSLAQPAPLATLSEDCSALEAVNSSEFFVSGRLGNGVTALAYDPAAGLGADGVELERLRGSALGVSIRGVDRNAQEDAREITMQPNTAFALQSPLESKDSYRIVYQVQSRPRAPVHLVLGTADERRDTVDITQTLSIAEGKDWREMLITPECAPGGSSGFGIESDGAFTFQIASVSREALPEGTACAL